MTRQTILLTGATGFIGRHLAERLEADHVLWKLTRRATGKSNEVIQNLGEALQIARFPRHVDHVIHAGGIVGEALATQESCRSVNVEATRQLLDYAVDAGAKSFVLFSSGGIYRPGSAPLTEDSVVEPEGIYNRSKWEAENVVRGRWKDLSIKVIRPFFPYGPGQVDRFVPRLIDCISRREAVILNNREGDPLLNPIFIDDLVEFVYRLIWQPKSLVVNLAGLHVLSVREFAEKLGREMGIGPVFQIRNARTGLSYIGDTTLAQTLTGYQPQVDIAEGIRRVTQAFSNAKL